MNKVYWSKVFDPTDWNCRDFGVLTVWIVPKRWWSVKEWKFAYSLRAKFIERLMFNLNNENQ